MSEPKELRKLTKAQRREQDRAATLAAKEAEAKKAELNRRNRRLILAGIGLGGGAIILGGANFLINRAEEPEMPAGGDLLAQKLILQKGPQITYRTNGPEKAPLETKRIPGSLDRTYLFELYSKLQEETLDPTERTNKVINNLSRVATFSKEGTGNTNALMIDECGIFITCGHTFITLEFDAKSSIEDPKFNFRHKGIPAEVTYPALGQKFRVLQYIADPKTELAVFYAPTGYKRKRIEGTQIRTGGLAEGESLWQTALFPGKSGLDLHIMSGSVISQQQNSEHENKSPYIGRVGVVDMIPFGGSSGAPIIDSQARVVGVESGLFVKDGIDKLKPVERSDYGGSEIAPLTALNQLLRSGEILKLPQ